MRHPGLRSAACLLLLAGLAAGCSPAASPQRIEIRVHYSHFDPSQLTVARDAPVTFVLINDDPIDHEWLIGDAAFHERHRRGTEADHGARPNEVSVPALSTVETTLTFADAGMLQYICHLPLHEAYGMAGSLTIT